ncbi:uncharacterized protein LOC113562798 [Ooceraea biroi]|uniref:uncharacterized protein LOC113562798 n=1 Tax=Ooceraea biroi TaxID=2015173 RepID=UPI000F074D76|nr:uncharacterized protein LOC113562798 [Ooceraea biroi]
MAFSSYQEIERMERESPLLRVNDEMIEQRILDRIDVLIDRKMEKLLASDARKERVDAELRREEETAFPPLPPKQQVESGRKDAKRVDRGKQSNVRKGKDSERRQEVENAEEKRKKTVKEKKKESNGNVPRRIREGRTAAISLRILENSEGLSYADAIKKAKGNIDVDEMGIERIRVRTAINGGRVLEIGGDKAVEKAEELSRKLSSVFQTPYVKVKRIQRKAEVQLWGIDEATVEEEAIQAISNIDGCAIEDIDGGKIKRTEKGIGSLWLRLPIKVAWTIAKKRQIKIGWNSVNVSLLQKRPVQYFKCFEFGHWKANCRSEISYSDRCYTCGGQGHIARECDKRSRCIICKNKGLDFKHRMGDKLCKSKNVSDSVNARSGLPDNEGTERPISRIESSEIAEECVSPTCLDQTEETEGVETVRDEERSFEEIVVEQVEAYHKVMADHQTSKPQRAKMKFEKGKVEKGDGKEREDHG